MRRKPSRATFLLGAERLLWGAGAVLLGGCLLVFLDSWRSQAEGERLLDAAGDRPPAEGRPPRPASALEPGDLVGRIEVRRLGLRAIVREGDDASVLRRAVGHVPGTALPGQRGNVCLAAHRDTFFRSLARVRKGDLVELVAPGSESVYRVSSTAVVPPDDTRVLAASRTDRLTLVTCYPFTFIGPAPLRFVVTAQEVAGAAGSRGTAPGRRRAVSARPGSALRLRSGPAGRSGGAAAGRSRTA